MHYATPASGPLPNKCGVLTPDRLARSYCAQILITDELARHGVQIHYLDAPAVRDNPEATLLVQECRV
jgi:DNA invertase Pin-like site-specific DNA recombinase